ncbi:MAG: altronate dehydratase family protein [Rhodospirillales bacterium]|nr:altronate dehydratase family protein [Rhodospirillales bacterium]MDE0712459.1 altronate dehydratase family protein [Rhodospirillales bacterium]
MTAQETLTIRLNAADNVVTAKTTLAPDTAVPSEDVVTARQIPVGHKIATRRIDVGDAVRKYNQIIGFATETVEPGDHVHTHNVAVRQFQRDYEFTQGAQATAMVPEAERATFRGIQRPDGRVATRNYIGVLSSVNCSATVCRYIADTFKGDGLKDFPNVDGVVAITHGTGCGMAGKGLGWDLLQATMAGYARHPNFAGILVVGLGCEVNQVDTMAANHEWSANDMFQMMTIQDTGGTRATIQAGVERIRHMLPRANDVRRTPLPASHIRLALQCGGSDAYSGMTANPALGAAVDRLVRHGGTATLAETPEIYGAEHLLTRRAVSEEIGEKLIKHVRWWEDYTEQHGAELNNNPSPGNQAGGLTTILEKSLGAVAKGGTTNLVDVYQYAEAIRAQGFTFMNTPGYDVVSVTGMVAGGANVVCFTTGRGSVFGCKPAPSIKLATNSPMYERMSEDMDVNCGQVLDGTKSIDAMGEEVFDTILRVVSGEESKSEAAGLGDEEFVPWQIGALL